MGKGDAALTLAASHEHLLSTEGSLQEWKTPNHFVPNTSPFQGYFLRKNVLSSCCPIVAEEEAGCSFLSSDSLRYGELLIWGKEELSRSTSLGEACKEIKQMHSGSFGFGFVNFWLLFCFCCVFCSLGLFVCFLMKANLNEDRNSSPYFPLEQRSFPVSEPTRLHAMPVTSPGCVRALDRGGGKWQKKGSLGSLLFSPDSGGVLHGSKSRGFQPRNTWWDSGHLSAAPVCISPSSFSSPRKKLP